MVKHACKLLAKLHQDLVLKPMPPAARVWHFVTQGQCLDILEFFRAPTFNWTLKHIESIWIHINIYLLIPELPR